MMQVSGISVDGGRPQDVVESADGQQRLEEALSHDQQPGAAGNQPKVWLSS
jgi:hypothetical protein